MLRPLRGVLVALEGIDGAGKTTQAVALTAALTRVGLAVVASKEPTNGPWGQRIRESAASGRMNADEELHAFTEDRRAHVADLISPSLDTGAIVIVDRYYYSTAAYQGPRGFDPNKLVEQAETFAPRPDLLVIIDVPVPVGLGRIGARGDIANAFERADTLERCAAVFRSFSGAHILHIDGMQSPEDITQTILQTLYDGAIFRAFCRKDYKDECEPAFCAFRQSCEFLSLGALSPVRLKDEQPMDDVILKVHEMTRGHG